MGNTIWVAVHGRPTSETASDSSIMYRLMDNLDALAVRLKVRKLSEFYDFSELEAAFDDLEEDADDDEHLDEDEAEGDEELDDSEDDDEENASESLEKRQAKGEWFDSAEGLKAIQTLRQHLAEHFDDLGFVPGRSNGHGRGS